MSIEKDTRKPATNYPHHREIFYDRVVVASLHLNEKANKKTLIIPRSASINPDSNMNSVSRFPYKSFYYSMMFIYHIYYGRHHSTTIQSSF